ELINAGIEKNDQTKKPNTRSRVEELTHQFENIGVNLPKTQYVTSNFELSLLRLSPNGHLSEWRKERKSTTVADLLREMQRGLML
ncbi:26067_t:CDS:2, partial [Gigaspora rosea]